MQRLSDRFPDAYAWALTGPNPAYLRLPVAEVVAELRRRTGYPWSVGTLMNHASRLGLHRRGRRSRTAALLGGADEDDEDGDGDTETDAAASAEERVATEQEILRLRAEQRYLRELARQEARVRTVLAALREAVAVLPPPPPYTPPTDDADAAAEPHSVLLQITDLHVGKWVDPGLVGDRFQYDRSELEARVARWQAAVRRIVALHRHAYPVEDCYVLLLGDIVEGSDMRPIQKLRIDHAIGTLGRQTVYAGRLLATVVRDLAADFRRVTVLAVPGNHGRIGRFGDNEVVDNLDWLAYHLMAAELRAVPNVRCLVSDRRYLLFRIGDKLYYAQHGDAIRSWGESPANAITRAVRKDAFVHQRFVDYAFLGHFHQEISLQIGGAGRVYVGGSWDGGDAYTVGELKQACEPVQNLFLLTPRRGIVAQYSIALTDKPRPPSAAVVLDDLFADADTTSERPSPSNDPTKEGKEGKGEEKDHSSHP
jgi:hypothetical protein